MTCYQSRSYLMKDDWEMAGRISAPSTRPLIPRSIRDRSHGNGEHLRVEWKIYLLTIKNVTFLHRRGPAPSAEGCATAVCVVRRRGVVQRASWWDWPATTATTMSTSIWRGRPLCFHRSLRTVLDRSIMSMIITTIIVFWQSLVLFSIPAFRRSCRKVQSVDQWGGPAVELMPGGGSGAAQYCRTHFNAHI